MLEQSNEKKGKTIKLSPEKAAEILEKKGLGVSAPSESSDERFMDEKRIEVKTSAPESVNVTNASKEEPPVKVDVCEAFANANESLQKLCTEYPKILKSFKACKEKVEAQRTEIRSLKTVLKEDEDNLDGYRTRERQLLAQINTLEIKQNELAATIRAKDGTIAEKENEIESLRGDLIGRDSMIEILKRDDSKQSDAFKNKLASSLKLDYQDFLECKDVEISDELGELFRAQIDNIFRLLKKEGVDL